VGECALKLGDALPSVMPEDEILKILLGIVEKRREERRWTKTIQEKKYRKATYQEGRGGDRGDRDDRNAGGASCNV